MTPTARAARTLFICFLAAILEGLDLQSAGVAAPRIGPALHLNAGMLAIVFSISTLGLLPGAVTGGFVADRVGRKRVLIGALLIYGVFSIATALTTTFGGLIAIRFMTGLGLGAALPTLISLAAEAVSPARRSQAIGFMYAGVPGGGMVAALTALLAKGPSGWHTIFYLGGALPLLLVPLMMLVLPESSAFLKLTEPAAAAAQRGVPVTAGVSHQAQPLLRVLFGDGRALATLMLWLSYFFTLLVVYLLLNWLPSLLVGRGFTHGQAGIVQLLLNGGAMLGCLVYGFSMDRGTRWIMVLTMYGGVLVSLIGMIYADGFAMTALAASATGFFSLGGQLVLYALAPTYYSTVMRGTGVGAAVGVGRLGAIAGPLLAGVVLSAGYGTTAVLMTMMPGLVIASVAALSLVTRRGLTRDPPVPVMP